MMTDWKEITDPEELFRLKREGWEIERLNTARPDLWAEWDGCSWVSSWKFRARPRQPKMKKVKMLCWINQYGQLQWWDVSTGMGDSFTRFPAGDIEGEIPE